MINQHIQRLRTAENGFDLVQALVVVVILGALATIAVLTLLGQVGKGDAAVVKADTASAVSTAKRIQAEDGSTTAWAGGIVAAVQDEVPSAAANTTDGPLDITVTKNGYGCEASIALATGVVSYGTPAGSTTEACPE